MLGWYLDKVTQMLGKAETNVRTRVVWGLQSDYHKHVFDLQQLAVVSSILGSLSILLITFLGSIIGNSHLPFQYLSYKYPRKLAPNPDIILLCIANVTAMIFHNHIFRDMTNSLISARTLHPSFDKTYWQDHIFSEWQSRDCSR